MKKVKLPALLLLAICVSLFQVPAQVTLGEQEQRPANQTPHPQVEPVTLSGFKRPKGSKTSQALTGLAEEQKDHDSRGVNQPFKPSNPQMPVIGDLVVIDAVASGESHLLLHDLESLGLQSGANFGRMVSGLLPISSISDLEELDSLNFVRPAYFETNTGSVTSQGDTAQRSNLARSNFGVDGSGVTMGTLSDSYNCQSGAAAGVASNDLPSGIVVLQEDPGCSSGTDEGRAMMEIVHDVAPGATQAFHTALGGIANFARGIEELAGCPPGSQPGCVADPSVQADVIVDDVGYFAEPMFQDGAIAQAVDNVVANGVAYFSSAGNSGRLSYESAFVNSGQFPLGGAYSSAPAHDFDPGGGVDIYQSVTIPAGCSFTITLQWDDPFFSVSGSPGADTDLVFAVFDSSATTLLGGVDVDNVGSDPVEVLPGSAGASPFTFNIVILKYSGPDPGLMKYVISSCSGTTINQFNTSSSAMYGHPNAASARAVGAASYVDTPAFGTSPPVLETFSSAGPTSILFNTSGASITPEVRAKPEFTAPDGGNTTFFGQDSEPDGFPNFSGTSAAAPHAAGVAALMLDANPSLTPAQIYSSLQSTAIDMGPAGFDNDSGYGLIDANAAVGDVVLPCPDPNASVDWTIPAGQSCTLSSSATIQGNVIVEAGATLTIASGQTLNIDLSTNHLLIQDGAKVVIQDGGKIQ